MTEPRRHTADTITDNDLDQLYAELAASRGTHREAVQYWFDAASERLERAEQAEAAIARVRALTEQLASEEYLAAAYADAARRIRAALDEPKEPTP